MAAIVANCAISLNCELTQPVKVQYIDGNMFSMDNAGNTAHVYVFYNGEPQEIVGSVSADVIRSDGTTVAITGAMSGNRAYVIFPQSCYAVPGVVSVVIKVTEGTTVTTIAAFVANVYRSSTDAIVDPGTIIPSVQNLISAIETAVASIPADYSSLWESLAPDYTNITFPVTAGKYCTYNGTLYVAKVDIATTESFTAAHWQSTNIGDNLSALKSAFEAFEKTGTSDNFEVNGGIVVTNGTTSSGSTRLTTKTAFTKQVYQGAKAINGYKFAVFAWDGDTYIGSYRSGTFAKTSGSASLEEFDFAAFPSSYKFKIAGRRSDSGTIALSEKTNFLFVMNIVQIDKTLSVEGDAADAEAVGDLVYVERDRSRVTPMPYGHYRTTGLDALDFRDLPLNTYVYTTFSKISAGLSDTDFPGHDWLGTDYVSMKRSAAGANSNGVSIVEFFNYSRTSMFIMLYYATSDVKTYQWISTSPVNNNTINYTYNQYANEYNISASPEITTDTNNYLQPSGDTTDMASAIETMLTQTGVCNLAPGDFYVSGVDMPDNAMIRGSGASTRIYLLDSVTDGYAIKMGTRCIVEDCRIMGATTQYTPTSTIGTRNGIVWQGTATSQSATSSKPVRGTISNCYISNFSGGGIYCQGTGTNINNNLNVVNVFIHYCTVGIYIPLLSEFNKFTNVDCFGCYWGSINNGGNNVFANCGFSKNIIGVMIDNEYGQSTNSAHGTYTGCVFNHSGENNDGVAIKLLGITAREIFTGCQIFFGEVVIDNCKGIVMNACNFGNSIPITITDGNTVLFNSCIFRNAPTITKTNNSDTHFVACYTNDGDAVGT